MYYQNQLKFNPDVASKPLNMAVKFQQPQPLVIEKFSHSVPLAMTSFAHNNQSAMHLSTVSEDQLSMAVHLAKRDLQKQKEAEMIEKHLAKMNKGRTKPVEKPVNRPHFRAARKTDPKVKPRKTPLPNNKQKVVKKPPAQPAKGILHMSDAQNTTVNSVAHESLDGVITMTHEEFTLREIRRLKMEMDNCMGQMKKIEDVAKNGNWVARTLPGTEDLPLEEVQRRRAEWAEKQDHQSSRVIYTLQQQVKAIQKDLGHTKTPFPQKVRKQFLQRVAATYRKAVRGLQTLVNQLVDYDLSKGLPQSCHEFQQLMRQLAMCTAQLDIASSDQVPESVKEVFADILKQIEIAKHLHGESAASEGGINFNKPKATIIKKETVSGPAKDNVSTASLSPERQQALRQGMEALIRAADDNDSHLNLNIQRQNRSPHGRPQHSPGRQYSPHGRQYSPHGRQYSPHGRQNSPHERLRHSPQGRAVAWEVPINPKGPPKKSKGLLLPHNLQTKRQHAYRSRQSRPRQRMKWTRAGGYSRPSDGHTHAHAEGPSHYSQPTTSSKLRAVYPTSPRQEQKKPWYSPGRSPRLHSHSSERRKSVSPRCCATEEGRSESDERDERESRRPSSHHSPRRTERQSEFSEIQRGTPNRGRPSGPSYPRRNPRLDKPWEAAQREIQKKVQFDRQTAKEPRTKSQERKSEIDRLRDLRSEVRQQTGWAANAANQIRDELQPILRDSLVDENAQQLADMILQDALDETITDLENGNVNGEMQLNGNRRSLDTPTLETMLEKLREMEEEESEIRQRWATVVYEDVNGRRARFNDVNGSNQPRTPPLLEISNSPSKPRRVERSSDDFQNPSSIEPIVFSRPGPQKMRYENLQLSSRGIEMKASKHKPKEPQKNTRVPITLSPDLVARIHENRERFMEHLQTNSNAAVGKFNPWHLVEIMADEIMEDCFSDVVNEIEQIHSDIANNIYESEFRTVTSSEPATPESKTDEGSARDIGGKDS